MPRKKIDIDPEQVRKLAEIGLNNVDIAGFFGCEETTIRKGFPEYLAKGKVDRKITLHGGQYAAAKEGNVAMLIWLGKNELGQVDRREIGGKDGGPLDLNLNLDLGGLSDDDLGALQTIAAKLALGADATAPGESPGG